MTPIGISDGAIIVRENVSASDNNIAPKNIEAGKTKLLFELNKILTK